jgi:hypothetical protein
MIKNIYLTEKYSIIHKEKQDAIGNENCPAAGCCLKTAGGYYGKINHP